MPALFTTGHIVKPKIRYLRRDGTYQDFNGYRCAQGWIVSDDGVNLLGGVAYWDPSDSSAPIPGANQQSYTVRIWDVDTQSTVDVGYPQGELEPGEYDVGTPLADDDGYAVNSTPMLNLIKARFEVA